MKFLTELTHIQESFNTAPVKWQWTKTEKGLDKNNDEVPEDHIAVFTVDGNVYQTELTLGMPLKYAYPPYTYIASFGLKKEGGGVKTSMTKTGNQYVVLNTVIDILGQFIKDNYKHIGDIKFSAEKPTSEDVGRASQQFSQSRAKVYSRLIKKHLQNLPGKWTVSEEEDQFDMTFHLTRH